MSQSSRPKDKDFLLALAAYTTTAAVAVFGVMNLRQNGQAWELGAVLSLLFGLFLAFSPGSPAYGWRSNLYLAVQTTLVLGLLFLARRTWSIFPILYFINSAEAMWLCPRPTGLRWIGIFSLITGVFAIYAEGWRIGLFSALPYAGGYYFFGAFAYVSTQAEIARRKGQELLDELQTAHRQLQAYADQVEELAVAEERNRLAREMHDTIGHRLTVSAVQLEGAQRLIPSDPERASNMVGTVRDQVREALSELRRTVARLRAPLDSDLSLPQALSRLTTSFEQATGLTIHLLLSEEISDLPAPYRLTLYRAAQEALTNIQRHAQAQNVWFQLIQQDETITLLVGDDGIGLPLGAEETGFGLRGLRERAAQLGGEFYAGPRPGRGTQLTFRLPLPVEAFQVSETLRISGENL